MKIIEKVKSYYIRFRWRIISGIALLLAIAVFAMVNSAPQSAVEKAIVKHHLAKGQKVKVSNLTYRPAPSYYLDSVRSASLLGVYDSLYNKVDGDLRWGIFGDPEREIKMASLSDSVLLYRERMKLPGEPLIKCDYTVVVSAKNTQFKDTLTLILNKKLTPVF